MKVLYIGCWKDGTGWSTVTQHNILAMDSVDIDVVPRAIQLTRKSEQGNVPARLLELEAADDKNCDICIQHVLPNYMTYHSSFIKNIGVFEYETDSLKHTGWVPYLNLMDEVWVPNNQLKKVCEYSGVNAVVRVVPHPCDTSRYTQYYERLRIPELDGKFVFYTIGECIRRKNFAGLLKAFHLEFRPWEPVVLVIKTNVTGQPPAYTANKTRQVINDVKRGLRLYPRLNDYHTEVILPGRLSDDEMMGLHATGDCFVLPSYGEAWCIPAVDAMGMGNVVVLNDEGGPADYVRHMENGFLLSNRREPAFMAPDEVPLQEVWTGNENWYSPDINELRHYMRTVYTDDVTRNKMSGLAIDTAFGLDYSIVGNHMKNLLEKE